MNDGIAWTAHVGNGKFTDLIRSQSIRSFDSKELQFGRRKCNGGQCECECEWRKCIEKDIENGRTEDREEKKVVEPKRTQAIIQFLVLTVSCSFSFSAFGTFFFFFHFLFSCVWSARSSVPRVHPVSNCVSTASV